VSVVPSGVYKVSIKSITQSKTRLISYEKFPTRDIIIIIIIIIMNTYKENVQPFSIIYYLKIRNTIHYDTKN
jgi:hypothetical protein